MHVRTYETSENSLSTVQSNIRLCTVTVLDEYCIVSQAPGVDRRAHGERCPTQVRTYKTSENSSSTGYSNIRLYTVLDEYCIVSRTPEVDRRALLRGSPTNYSTSTGSFRERHGWIGEPIAETLQHITQQVLHRCAGARSGSESAWRTLSNACENVRNELELVEYCGWRDVLVHSTRRVLDRFADAMGGSESAWRTLSNACENMRNETRRVLHHFADAMGGSESACTRRVLLRFAGAMGGSESAWRTLPDAHENIRNE
ncbi:hypothetical protein FA15DRAFT_662194 [Coprinopsis marcescibilis]|uniref:Uncharacterized protein n=1 Tax=Coprinopsis marcescibilis TaxID=230819 RepID=A0A5C3K8L8_COPMA|nr:hypothetical protein FA15DRAFT_662194 [Coprinopsis marcescibilis]